MFLALSKILTMLSTKLQKNQELGIIYEANCVNHLKILFYFSIIS